MKNYKYIYKKIIGGSAESGVSVRPSEHADPDVSAPSETSDNLQLEEMSEEKIKAEIAKLSESLKYEDEQLVIAKANFENPMRIRQFLPHTLTSGYIKHVVTPIFKNMIKEIIEKKEKITTQINNLRKKLFDLQTEEVILDNLKELEKERERLIGQIIETIGNLNDPDNKRLGFTKFFQQMLDILINKYSKIEEEFLFLNEYHKDRFNISEGLGALTDSVETSELSLDTISTRIKELENEYNTLAGQIKKTLSNLNDPDYMRLGFTEFKEMLDKLAKKQSKIQQESFSLKETFRARRQKADKIKPSVEFGELEGKGGSAV